MPILAPSRYSRPSIDNGAVRLASSLRAMSLTDRSACWTAWANTDAARKRGANDIEARIRGKWLEVAETELAKNKVTFAMLPMPELLSENGYLASLRAKGYVVEDPL